MALPVSFATLPGGNNPATLLDTQFAAVAALGSIPCAAAGQNVIALSPLAGTAPNVISYPDLAPSFVFAAAQTSNGAVTINVNLVGARSAYKWNGSVQCGSGDIIAGNVYRATPLQALNGGSGGFVVDAIGVNNNLSDIEFIIDGGGSAITAGNKGWLHVPWASTVEAWRIMGDQSGTITIDILRTNNGFPVTSMVGGGTKPNLTATQFTQTAPAGWASTVFAQDDWVAFNVTALATSVTKVTVVLSVFKS